MPCKADGVDLIITRRTPTLSSWGLLSWLLLTVQVTLSDIFFSADNKQDQTISDRENQSMGACGETFSCTASQGHQQGQGKDCLQQREKPLCLVVLSPCLQCWRELRQWHRVLPAGDSALPPTLPGRQLCCRGCWCCGSSSPARTELSPLSLTTVPETQSQLRHRVTALAVLPRQRAWGQPESRQGHPRGVPKEGGCWFFCPSTGGVLGSEALWRMPQLHWGTGGWNWWGLSSPGLPLAAKSLEGAVRQSQGGSDQALPGRFDFFLAFQGDSSRQLQCGGLEQVM